MVYACYRSLHARKQSNTFFDLALEVTRLPTNGIAHLIVRLLTRQSYFIHVVFLDSINSCKDPLCRGPGFTCLVGFMKLLVTSMSIA